MERLKRGYCWLETRLDPREPQGLTWIHYRVTATVTVLTAFILAAVLTVGTVAVVHRLKTTGYNPFVPPSGPRLHLTGGGVPANWSLAKYQQPTHDQGSSESCVAQTVTTIGEIDQAERGHPIRLSQGYLYNPIVQGQQIPTTYNDVFDRATVDGIAPFAAFPYDGQDSNPQPGYIPAAHSYRFTNWYYIDIGDVGTIKRLIASGIPVAVAMPWHDTLANAYGVSGIIYHDYGGLRYWHSTTLVGFGVDAASGTQYVVIANSFGPQWGIHGLVKVAWTLLPEEVDYSTGQAMRGAAAAGNWAAPYPKPQPFPLKKWRAYTTEHHKPPISQRYHGKLSLTAALWWHGHVAVAGAIVSREQWFPRGKKGRDGYITVRFQRQRLYYWPNHPKWKGKWINVRLIR